MLSSTENERLTRVSAGTPCGELLRRYWHPVAPASSLADGSPVPVRVLGEDLVLFREANAIAAIHERCPHRGASLRYGWVEDGGIRCPYHGWLFDIDGRCVERPFERERETIHACTYPVEERSGLLFIYMGPAESSTPLPPWDILARRDGSYRLELQDDLRCNWLQIQENAADVTHTYFVHAYSFRRKGIEDISGFDLPLKQFGFQPFEWGIVKSWIYVDVASDTDLEGWGNPLIFPNILRLETEIHWRVPVDDMTTRIFVLAFEPDQDTDRPGNGTLRLVTQPERSDSEGVYKLDTFFSQDAMVWETQGLVADRTSEHLGASDVGIRMFRKMLSEQIRLVEEGSAPSLARAVSEEQGVDLREWMGGYLPMSAPADPTVTRRKPPEQIFDERHVKYIVPVGKARPEAQPRPTSGL